MSNQGEGKKSVSFASEKQTHERKLLIKKRYPGENNIKESTGALIQRVWVWSDVCQALDSWARGNELS